MDPDRQLDRLTRQLSLTAEQQSQIKPLLVDRQQKMQALFQEQSLSREDRRARAETIASETKGKIEAVLNDQQKQKYEAMQERMRHGGGNGEGAPAGGSAPPQ
jgi:Spy/CpxP family protein refolding chaperone